MNFKVGRRKGMPVADRIERMTTMIPFSGCKIFLGKLSDGYGRLDVNGKPLAVHRAAWELKNGEIPERMVLAHTCDVRSCCNTDHLFLATQSENMIDAVKKGRMASQKLTVDDVKFIRFSEKTSNELSGMFHVTERQIRKIRQNKLHFTFLH